MSPAMFRGRLTFLAVALVLAHAVPACVGGAESGSKLNPQPLPPLTPGEDDAEEGDRATSGGSAAPGATDGGGRAEDGGPDAQDAGVE